nr:NFX1-type zinc finger-containing protein 1-like [Anolis sagrei ordinatus]
MPGPQKRGWSHFPSRGSRSPPCKARRLSSGPPRRPESPPDVMMALMRLSDRGYREQLLSFFQAHEDDLSRVLDGPGLGPRDVHTLLRVVKHVLEGPPGAQDVRPVLDLVLRPAFVLRSLLGFIASLETFHCPDGEVSREVMVDTVAALHHLLEAAPEKAQTLLCYPVDLLCATVQRLQSRGLLFAWVTQKQLKDTKGLLDAAFQGSSGPRGAGLESLANRDDFCLVPVFPTPEDIFLEPTATLKPNLVSGRYKSDRSYLDTHFRLLREDLVKPLRDGISSRFTLRSLFSNSQKPPSELRLYRNVQLSSVGYSPAGVTFQATFQGKSGSAATKSLLSGSLVCLLSEDDDGQVLFGTVAGSRHHEGSVWLDIKQSHTRLLRLLGRATFTMAESPAFFESYRHVLEGLKEMEAEPVPFRKYLVKCRRKVSPPAYLQEEEKEGAGLVTFDLSALHPPKDKPTSTKDLAKVGSPSSPEASADHPKAEGLLLDLSSVSPLCPQLWRPETFPHLDESQVNAVRTALGSEFVLIQGPPGTGKTFIGLKILQILLDNESLWNKANTPCLVVCYTNHALDQFLEGVLDFLLMGVVRIGGRSKSQRVSDTCALRNLRQRQPHYLRPSRDRQRFAQIKEDLGQQKSNIDFCTEVLQLLRRGVLTERELELEIGKDHLWIPQGSMLRWLKLFPPEVNRKQPPRRQENSRKMAAGPSSQFNNAELFQPHRDERFLDDDYDEAEAERRGASNSPKEKFAYIVPEEESAHKKWLLACLANEDTMTNEEVAEIEDSRNVQPNDRWRLYRRWLAAYENELKASLVEMLAKYEKDAAELQELTFQEDLRILRGSRVIGMTTTGAAKYRKLLQCIRPRIVMVEEAAEILEAHVLTSLTPSCQHLILIGDHQQLRPKPADYTLEKKYHLGVSLFERMINNHLPHVQLLYQHRMRPEISQLLVPFFYKELRDHQVVLQYESIKGMEKNVFFVQHREEESHSADSESYSNRHEAAFLASLTGYLLKQGYGRSQITILTPYHGQVVRVRTLLRHQGMEDVAVHAVDDFQGEENDIVLLSLVRSNSQGKIGFLKDKNRLCVALSRAKKGFYCLGNLDVLSAGSSLWKEISGLLKSKALLGEELTLMCQNHPETKTAVKASADFKALPDGGCALKCQTRLECGHPCTRRCHPLDQDHRLYRCTFPCSRVLCERKHKCPKKCKEECRLCEVKVEKVVPKCGHSQAMPCHLPPEVWVCQEHCQKALECGHLCKLKCGMNCQVASCKETVQVTLPCSHVAETECFRQKMPLPCQEKCLQKLDCGHICQGSCHQCIGGRVHATCRQKCTRVLLCSHTCQGSCSENCPPCKKMCRNRCPHSRCSKTCGEFCFRCVQRCSWRCKHHQCTQMCWEICNRPRCDRPCKKILRCKHPCVGLCGEPCPPKCRVCHRNELAEIFFGKEDEPESRFVVLKECGHIFEVRGLDRWMEGNGDNEFQAKPVQQKVCPKCSTPIQSNPRYSNVIKATQQGIADIKRRMFGSREQLQFGRAALLSKLIVMPPHNRYFRKEALKREIEAAASLQSLRDCESTVRLLLCLQRLRDRATHCTDEQGRRLVGAAEALESWLHRRQRGDAFAAQQLRECRNEVKRLSYLANVFERLTIYGGKQMPSSSTATKAADKALSLLTGPQPFTEAQEGALLPVLETLDHLMPASGPRLSQAEKVSIEEAMRFGRGQWYMCPNGHFYSVGQCGRPVEESQCPECRATIGGRKKRVHAGNVTASLTLETGNGGKEVEGRPLSSIGDLVGLSDLLPPSIYATDHSPAGLDTPSQANDSQREGSGQLPDLLIPASSCHPYGSPLDKVAKGTTPSGAQQEGSGEVAMEETPSLEQVNAYSPETTSQDHHEPMEQDNSLSPQACTTMDPLEIKEEDISWSPQACTEHTTMDLLEPKE